jgi:hypothetical protein
MPQPSNWERTPPLPRATPYVVHHIGDGRSIPVGRIGWTAGAVTLIVVGATLLGKGVPWSEARQATDPGEASVAAPTTPPPAAAPIAPPTTDVRAPSSSTAPPPSTTAAPPPSTSAVTLPAASAPADPYAAAARYVAAMPTSRVQLWERVAHCESRGTWDIATGNGYYGGLQFSLQSWHAVGGVGRPDQAPRSEQLMRAELLWDRQGWEAWPDCASELGLTGD